MMSRLTAYTATLVVMMTASQLFAEKPDAKVRYDAEIRRTSHGVAHITAKDLASLGFGEGYAQAEDHLCTIADQVVKARGERAKYFGPGRNDEHLANDITMRAMRIWERGGEMLKRQPTSPAARRPSRSRAHRCDGLLQRRAPESFRA